MKKKTKKRILYGLLGLTLLAVVGVVGGLAYFKYTWFRDQPNTLVIEGELHSIPMKWSGNVQDPHAFLLIPVSIPGFDNIFHMQFDTGSPVTYLKSGALESLMERGYEVELFKKEKLTYFREFEFNVGGNKVALKPGWVRGARGGIDWDNPNSNNVIGTIGSDLLDQRICAIDFAAMQIRLYENRPQIFDTLGTFTPFDFKGRKIVMPVTIDGSSENLIYDSGCSAFGLLTSGYYYDQYSDPNEPEIQYNGNRHGDPIPIHHRTCDLTATFGEAELPLKRISYVNLYAPVQALVGRFSSFAGFIGVLGNEPLTESTLIFDAKTNEYLVVPGSAPTPVSNQQSLDRYGKTSLGKTASH